jgi:hypothetical protein
LLVLGCALSLIFFCCQQVQCIVFSYSWTDSQQALLLLCPPLALSGYTFGSESPSKQMEVRS